MCAIAGFVNMPSTIDIQQALLSTMRRRGPDGEGTYTGGGCTLLHTRLAIIDPTNGCQPMQLSWHGETYIIAYNGELYNTKELRMQLQEEGHIFQTQSDTEVLLHSYAQWGPDCLHRINGIFAFAIWEERRKRLFLARDRIGVKPLFYINGPDGLLFASEIKTILAYPGMKAQLDADGVAELLLLGPGRTPGCGVFRNIHEVKPGHYGFYAENRLQLKQYWKLRDQEHTDSWDATAEKVRWLVTDAIERQMVSDVPIGTFLSGGLDSSLISTICCRQMQLQGERLQTFSVDYANNERYFVPGKFQPNSDKEYIHIMREYLHTEHTETVLLPEQLLDTLAEATVARDLPGMADVDFSLLLLCEQIRNCVKVALSGECADEIFGGYPWYRDPEIRQAEGFPWAQNTAYRASFVHPEHLRKLHPDAFVKERYWQTIKDTDILPGTNDTDRRMKEMVNLNQTWFMQTLLDRKDRMSMYCGLEVRVPFCDHRIAEYLYTVPWEFKDYRGREKGLLRYAMEGVIPDSVLYRKKSPYPKTYDPRYLELVSARLDALLQDASAPIFDVVNRKALMELKSAEYEWPWYGQLMKVPQTISYMLQIDFWLRKYQVEII